MTTSFAETFNGLNAENRVDGLMRIPARPELMDKIRDALAEAAAEFPDELGNLVAFPVPGAGDALFMTNKVQEQLTKNFANNEALKKNYQHNPAAAPQVLRDAYEKLIRESTQKLSGDTRVHGTMALPDAQLYKIPVKLIALASSNHFQIKYPDRFTEEMAAMAVTDLAVGKLIFGGVDAAEAYAALCHRKRFPGQNTDYALYRREAMASGMILKGNADQYAVEALDQAMAFKLAGNVSLISLTEIAMHAEDIADRAVLPEYAKDPAVSAGARLQKILDAYAPVAEYHQRHTAGETTDNDTQARDKICAMTRTIMKENHQDADIVKAGQGFLGPETQQFTAKNAPAILKEELNTSGTSAQRPQARGATL